MLDFCALEMIIIGSLVLLLDSIVGTCLQVKETEIVLNEGAADSHLTIITTVPPTLLCPVDKRTDAVVKVLVTFTSFTGAQKTCPNGNSIIQAVIRSGSDNTDSR